MAISDGGHGQDTSTGFCIASESGGVDLSLLVNNSQLADTQIQCSNGDTLVGHAAILSLQSEWFRQQLATKHEGNEKGADMFRFRFSLPADAPTCLLVLRFLYTSKANIPDSSVLSVLRLASFLGIKQLANQCAAYFERKLLSPASAVHYADFLFYLKELGGDYGITDSEAAFVKVSACLKRDVQLATNSFESRQILSTFNGDQICDLCTLINSESLVVWLLCLSWIHSVHSSPSSSTETLVSTEPTLIPSENLLAAKQDLQDLLLLLNLHSFTLQEYTTHLEPHLYLLHAKPRTRVEAHYSNSKATQSLGEHLFWETSSQAHFSLNHNQRSSSPTSNTINEHFPSQYGSCTRPRHRPFRTQSSIQLVTRVDQR
ncbi:hypothetical protein BCR33DRAFT_564903 [Rhizoclosmatium globosum]|uniref:BTB domain-containing protein n=1 Tax=Rhizoclosmatium globosum TaxID=329046 RepID=A0A1Y2B873_9FUNG|nr:hypothetical protein BCR33DRAFT_564903 [Rhizoclosmatium globosum]|eukprot:ORY30697.1 hypothetical protein BCR33DRAFT_564903 [Rhizoclosmatium globosum]